MPRDNRPAPSGAHFPPAGYGYFARRLNRHSYHLYRIRSDKALCDANDEISDHTMEYLLAQDGHKRCLACLELAGEHAQVAEVIAAKAKHEDSERAHEALMRQTLVELGTTENVNALANYELRERLLRIRNASDDALKGAGCTPF
jgi:hypothetical protein